MWYKTELMEQILTSESAKRMIDYVSPIYGKSRIALWLFQIISNLREQFYRYRLEYVKDTDYHIVLLNEHKELVNAIESGKKEEARQIMKKHITNQEMTVIRNIKEEY